MVHIINRLMQSDDVPLSCNLFFNCAFFATSKSWIPVVFAQPSFERNSVSARWYQRNILEVMPLAFVQLPHDILRRPFKYQPYVVLRYRRGLPLPTKCNGLG